LTLSSPTKLRRNSGSSSAEGGDLFEEKIKSLTEALASAIASTESEAGLRLRKEQELESIMEELIDTKLRYAHVASELDVERAKTTRLRDKLLRYAERLTSLEVHMNIKR
jgi:chromosome segregation ATPase